MDLDGFLSREDIKFFKDHDTSLLSSIKCGGKASYLILPSDEDKLIKSIKNFAV